MQIILFFPDRTEADVNRDYLNDGVYLEYETDIDGAPILLVRSFLHVKGLRDETQLGQIFVFWMERLRK